MAKPSLTLLFNIAPHYREAIYRRINETFNCQWIIGDNDTDIPSCDIISFEDVKILPIVRGFFNTYWLRGALRFFFGNESSDNILMLGEIKFLTTWWVIFRNLFRSSTRKKKLYFWSHGWTGTEGKLKCLVYKFYFSRAAHIFFYGNRSKEIAIKNGISPEKISVIHNSLDHIRLSEIRENLEEIKLKKSYLSDVFNNPELPLLIYIGRLNPHKKLEWIIESLYDLKEKGQTFNLIIIGEGPEMKRLEEKVKNNDLKDNVWFGGAMYEDKTSAPYLYLSDACISPGHIGLTAIHSLEMGTPVITHNDFARHAPEVEAIKPDYNGDFFIYNDINSLAETIYRVIKKSTANRRELRDNCIKSLKDWTPDYQINLLRKTIK